MPLTVVKCCKVCNSSKPLELFPKASVTKDGRAGTCKVCTASKWKSLRIERGQLLFKMNNSECKDCKMTHDNISFFDFHHLDPSTKKCEVKSIICSSWDKVLEEAAKCVMLCPNCHRIRHLEE